LGTSGEPRTAAAFSSKGAGVGKKTFIAIVIVFAVLALAAAAMHGGDGALHDWLRSMHGR
jgi:hypothetical protein